MEQLPKKPIIHITLSPEEYEQLEQLSALDYSIDNMAMFFDRNKIAFRAAAADENSTIAYHIARGKLVSAAQESMSILKNAEGGSVSASQQLANIKRNKSFAISKREIFEGFDHTKTYRILEDWILGGCKNNIKDEENVYLEALSQMNAMDRKYGRKNTIAFFTKPPYSMKHSRAAEMYDEAFNLFNTDRNINKKAYRNKYADDVDELYLLAKNSATTSKDLEVAGDLKMKAAKLRELDKADPEPLPAELYLRPVRLFTLNPGQVGMPEINRQIVARQIEELEIPESDKRRVSADAMLSQINFEQQLDELQEESKS